MFQIISFSQLNKERPYFVIVEVEEFSVQFCSITEGDMSPKGLQVTMVII